MIERCGRDVQAATQHYLMSQSSGELQGKVLLGFEGLRAIE